MEQQIFTELKKHFHNANYSPRKEEWTTYWMCLCGEEYASGVKLNKTIMEAYNDHLESKIRSALDVGNFCI